MAAAHLDTESITDWRSFHEACRMAFGSANFYGMNMDAWVDCMSHLDEGAGLTRFNLAEGEMLHIEVSLTESFNRRLPEDSGALVECAAFVNRRYLKDGKAPVLSLSFV